MNFVRLTSLALLAALVGAPAGSSAFAQKASKPAAGKTQKKTTAKKATPKKRTTTGKKAKSAPAKTKAATPKKPAKKASTKKAPSVCVGLSKSQCGTKKQCGWVNYKKKVASNGRKLTDHCRKVAGIAKSKKK